MAEIRSFVYRRGRETKKMNSVCLLMELAASHAVWEHLGNNTIYHSNCQPCYWWRHESEHRHLKTQGTKVLIYWPLHNISLFLCIHTVQCKFIVVNITLLLGKYISLFVAQSCPFPLHSYFFSCLFLHVFSSISLKHRSKTCKLNMFFVEHIFAGAS